MNIFWFRRDLRLEDNAGLYHALSEGGPVLPVFIFDTDLLDQLKDRNDRRVQFIYERITDLKIQLQKKGSDLLVRHGSPSVVWQELLKQYSPTAVYTNHDYEPSARARDQSIEKICKSQGVGFYSFKDQVVFEKEEILTDHLKPYTVYTPYKKKWLAVLSDFYLKSYPNHLYEKNYEKVQKKAPMPALAKIGFQSTADLFPTIQLTAHFLKNYANTRDLPALVGGTSHLGLHLRFGTVSIREMAREGLKFSPVWLSELVWREFFMQVLYHFPQVETQSFRPEFEAVPWRKDPADFQRWCEGMTGYPLVDAGMRELNATGYMHNRARMVTASFLCKHLLIHWYEGERYFARKLLDYDLAANNGNWQWAAGTGCDAAPYFRIFNPQTQFEKFDKNGDYVRKWIPEFGTSRYPSPIVDHVFARQRALQAFESALKKRQETL